MNTKFHIYIFTTKARRKIRQDKRIFLPQRAQRTQRFLASLVFLAKPAFKASFVAVYCLRPQGHRNGLFHKPAKNGSCKTRRHEENSHEKAQKTQRKIRQDNRIFLPQRAQRTQSLLNLTTKTRINFATNYTDFLDADFADFTDLLATNEHEFSHIYIYHEGTKKTATKRHKRRKEKLDRIKGFFCHREHREHRVY